MCMGFFLSSFAYSHEIAHGITTIAMFKMHYFIAQWYVSIILWTFYQDPFILVMIVF